MTKIPEGGQKQPWANEEVVVREQGKNPHYQEGDKEIDTLRREIVAAKKEYDDVHNIQGGAPLPEAVDVLLNRIIEKEQRLKTLELKTEEPIKAFGHTLGSVYRIPLDEMAGFFKNTEENQAIIFDASLEQVKQALQELYQKTKQDRFGNLADVTEAISANGKKYVYVTAQNAEADSALAEDRDYLRAAGTLTKEREQRRWSAEDKYIKDMRARIDKRK